MSATDDVYDEIAALWHLNNAGNIVESAMRLRALTEISQRLDTDSLLSLAATMETRQPAQGEPEPRIVEGTCR